MVPQALEQKLVPVLQAATAAPLDHEALLVESIAAPSITLRFYGLNALLQAEPNALGDETWEVIEALKGDSHPQVQQLVIALMERTPVDLEMLTSDVSIEPKRIGSCRMPYEMNLKIWDGI